MGNAVSAIAKVLSRNDTGHTGAHQAGMLIPRDPAILSFFPKLDADILNPRHHLVFYDDSGSRWEFAFIYYNNSRFGGTRNEYRLTRMTPYLRSAGLKPGDQVVLKRDTGGKRTVSYIRAGARKQERGRLKVGSGWKIIDL